MTLLSLYLVPTEDKKPLVDDLISLERAVSEVEALVGQLNYPRSQEDEEEEEGREDGEEKESENQWAEFLDLHCLVIITLSR